MNWFKKSIAFDQKKKLLILSLMMIIPIIFNSISIAVIFSNRKSNTGWVPSFSYNGIDVLIILMVAFITVVSIGLRDRSEKGFITSMPMKKEDVLFTKMACSTIAVIIPIIIGFIVDTSIYLSNREVIVEAGYWYRQILFAYTGIILISLITIGIIFLVSLLFNNIKVPIVLIIIGGISSIYTIWNIVKSLDDTSIIRNNIYDLANYIFNTITGFTKNNSGYDPSIIGNFITLLGIAVLLFVLIRFIAENFSNDIYDNVFSFKISRILSYISILLFIGMIISGSIGILADLMYQPASEVYSYQDRNTALARIRMGAMVLTALISIRLTSKAMTKINEIF